jgi:hypothetical protein
MARWPLMCASVWRRGDDALTRTFAAFADRIGRSILSVASMGGHGDE